MSEMITPSIVDSLVQWGFPAFMCILIYVDLRKHIISLSTSIQEQSNLIKELLIKLKL